MVSLFDTLSVPTKKRRIFFSFHYQNDVWRVNQVRQSWRYNRQDTREAEGFFDGSIWESSKRTGPDSLKRLIREGLKNTSVTCVLTGAETYQRRWVRYEIARSVVKGNGLLAVKIHRMADRQGYASAEGPNPLDFMGLYRSGNDVLLAEYVGGKWVRYGDYTLSIDLPATWRKPHDANVISLSRYASCYCYKTQRGSENFSSWVRQAAADVGR